jgi:peptidyl-prolyl cis-trans isomerase D
MLSTMREKTKWVMVVLAVAFVGWLVFGVGMDITGRGKSTSRDIGSVNGVPIRYLQWQEAYRQAYDQARQQNPGVTFSREEQREIENQAFNALVQEQLLRSEYASHGIVVTDREIVDAVRRYPPQEVRQIPDLQTNGQFDPAKYERFLSSQNASTRQYLVEMEARLREELPRLKLLEEVTADVYVSDGRLWSVWHDQHDSVTVRALVIRPDQAVPATSVSATEAEAKTYFEAHPAEFRQPGRAWMSFVVISKRPTAVDSQLMVARARALIDSLRHGADFAAVARGASSDSASARNGGSLGTFGKGRMVKQFEDAAWRLPVGQVSDPVFTEFGLHIIKVEKRTADSITARHILLPYGRQGARLDTLEARADSLDRIGAEQTDPKALDSLAKRMSLAIEKAPALYQGVPYALGRYRVPDVGVWAFEGHVGETSPVIENLGGYYLFRLDSVRPAGPPTFAEAKGQAQVAVIRQKQRAAAETIARDAEARLAAGATLEQVADALHLTLTTLGPFVRTSTVPMLGTATPEIGAAFRLRVGERSGLLSNTEAFFILRSERRAPVDSAAWVAQKTQQRAQVIQAARQLRVQNFLDGLRRRARINDRRAEILRPSTKDAQAGQTGQ